MRQGKSYPDIQTELKLKNRNIIYAVCGDLSEEAVRFTHVLPGILLIVDGLSV